MGQFSNPVATHPSTNEVEVPPPPFRFSHDFTTGVGNATGTIIQSTGHAFKDVASGTGTFFQKFLGGFSGTILWTVILLIIIYLLYLKFAHWCFNRSAATVEPV